jgi:hypothetical protein
VRGPCHDRGHTASGGGPISPPIRGK